MDRKTREIVMAKLYLKNNDYKAAEKNFNDHLAQYPEDVQALKLLAQVYEKTNRNYEAFQMFERCYLIEPDRPGILLEVCRVLQKELLEQVDYHKWYSLAVKNFPTSPIVVDLKSFMSTLPPQRETISTNDPLSKILEKLTLMDSKFDNLNTRIGGLETNLKSIEKKIGQIEKVDVPAVKTTGVSNAAPTMTAQAPTTPISIVKTPTFSSSPAKAQPVLSTPTTSSLFKTSTNQPSIFQTSSNQPSIFQTPKPQQPQTQSLFSSIHTSNVQTSPAANKSSMNQNIIGQIPNSTIGQTFTFGQSSSTLFGGLGSAASSQGGNLFSESLHRLNLPAVGDWTTQTSGNSNMPFSSSTTTTSSQPITSNNPKKDANDDEDNRVQTEELPIENFCEMQPIEIKTGEEDEDILFKHRCKLFRLRDKEYKERGLGDIKVLKHKQTGKGRLIMRRDAVGLVCLNCWHCSKIERVRDNQVRIMGLDASDGEPEASCLLIKFKTPEITDSFLKHLYEIFPEDGLNESTASQSSLAKSSNSKNQQDSSSDKSEIELVDPKLDPNLVDKARQYQLPDLFYHKLKHEEGRCVASDGCEDA